MSREPRSSSLFWENVVSNGSCWLWTGYKSPKGYGKWSIKGISKQAHRVAYELCIGPIPEGKQLDHVKERGCVNRSCVNPSHLEPVTSAENTRRGTPNNGRASKTHCEHGHEFSLENTYNWTDGSRTCRTCGASRAREYRLKKKQKATEV